MAGGFGRAQGGYDEMVFRAMVRDDAHFYDPLGLESEGIQVDFQVGANDYLYGTRFFTYLAYTYSPEKVIALAPARRGQRALLRRSVPAGVRHSARARPGRTGSPSSTSSSARNLAEVRKNPITPHTQVSRRSALGSISRDLLRRGDGHVYGGYRYPGRGRARRRAEHARRQRPAARRHQAGDAVRVTSVAYDPEHRDRLLHRPTTSAWRDLMAVDVETRRTKTLFGTARIGEIVFNPADRSLIGVRHDNGLATLVRIPLPVYPAGTRSTRFPTAYVPYDLDISADGRLLSASVSEVNGDQFLRVWELDEAHGRESEAAHRIPLRAVGAGELRASPRTARYLYGSSYYTGVSNIFRYEVATGAVEAVSNAEPASFAPCRSPTAD